MKKVICGLFIAGCAACFGGIPDHRLPVADNFKFPEKIRDLDVYKTGRYDFDGDGIPEQIVIESGGGTGGPVWHIRRLNGEPLSGEMFGRVWLCKKKNNFPVLIVESKCGWSLRSFSVYEYNGGKYVCTRQENHDYEKKKAEIVIP